LAARNRADGGPFQRLMPHQYIPIASSPPNEKDAPNQRRLRGGGAEDPSHQGSPLFDHRLIFEVVGEHAEPTLRLTSESRMWLLASR
jgi:hypothetical protein